MKQNSIVKDLKNYFLNFYGYLGNKIFVLYFIALVGGISESIGISVLLPILNYSEKKISENIFGHYIESFLNALGYDVSLNTLLFLLIMAFMIKGLLTFLQDSLSFYIATGTTKQLRVSFYEHYSKMKYSYFTNTNIGQLNNIITTEIDRAVVGMKMFVDVVVCLIFIGVYTLFALFVNWKMTVFVLLASGAIFYFLRKLSVKGRLYSNLVSETNASIQSLLIQTIYNFKYLKATASFSNIFTKLKKIIDKNRLFRLKGGIIQVVPKALLEPLTVLLISSLILYEVNYNNGSVGGIFVLLLFFYKAFTKIFSFQIVWQKFNANIGGINAINKAKKDLTTHVEFVGEKKVSSFKKEIELKNVNLYYGNKKVLAGINLVIPKNKTIGIVGESGAGKTTLLDIIIGLISPDKGSITIDMINYNEIDLPYLRKMFGYITQEPVIFNDSIRNNISFWSNGLKNRSEDANLVSSANLAKCNDFIQESENKFETVIGDKGIKLSGGQRQRIGIAREVYKNTEVMILDEATSALDTESEKYIQESINAMAGEKTMIIVAHRLSTVRKCDLIYVVSKGQVVEQGTFEELYSLKGSMFFTMCTSQNLT